MATETVAHITEGAVDADGADGAVLDLNVPPPARSAHGGPRRPDGSQRMSIDMSTVEPGQLQRVMARAMSDLGVLANAPLKVLGRRLGLWRTLAGVGPSTPAEVAAHTGPVGRYVREWLFSQAASGWLIYDEAEDTFTLDDASAAVIVDEDSPAYFGLLTTEAIGTTFYEELDRLERVFREGGGFAWGDHAHAFLDEQAAFTGPFYEQFLTTVWIPSLIAALRSGRLRRVHACEVRSPSGPTSSGPSQPSASVRPRLATGPSPATGKAT